MSRLGMRMGSVVLNLAHSGRILAISQGILLLNLFGPTGNGGSVARAKGNTNALERHGVPAQSTWRSQKTDCFDADKRDGVVVPVLRPSERPRVTAA